MTEHARDEPAPGSEAPRLRPTRPSPAEIVEREGMEPGWAARTIRERRDGDDVPEPSMKDVLRDMDQYRRPDGPTSEEIVEALHEARQEREQRLNDLAAPGAAPRTPRSRHQ